MRLPLTLIVLLPFLAVKAQFDPDKMLHQAFDHRVIYNHDTIYSFYCLQPGRTTKPRPGKMYYWYKRDTILTTIGGYDGDLLNGEYKVSYPDKNLMEYGSFDKGLKTGVWKTWFPGGKPASVINWKNGQKEGAFVTYDPTGKTTSAGHYKADELPKERERKNSSKNKKDSIPN